jgi:prevent-host-death family protein
MALRERRIADTWSVAEAQAKFSEVIERAKRDDPQWVTKNGRDAVVVSTDEWERRNAFKGSLLDVLQKAQLKDGELEIERHPELMRDITL